MDDDADVDIVMPWIDVVGGPVLVRDVRDPVLVREVTDVPDAEALLLPVEVEFEVVEVVEVEFVPDTGPDPVPLGHGLGSSTSSPSSPS